MTNSAIAARLNARLGLQLERDNPREEVGSFARPPTISYRYTTSSRRPGAVNDTPVHVRLARVVVCGDCHGKALDVIEPGKHAPHWRRGHLVNCIGKEISL